MPVLPSGTIALLFTNVEGFTHHCAEDEAGTLASLRRQDSLLRRVVEAHRGVVYKNTGDAFYAAFTLPRDALAAAVEAQKRLQCEPANGDGPVLPVRMALHIGSPDCRQDDYFGTSVNTAAWLRDRAYGGQIVVTPAFYEMVRAIMGANSETTFQSLSAWHLRGMAQPEMVFQVAASGLPDAFPPLSTVSRFNGNLPVSESSFIGRGRALRQIAQQIEQHPLMTLCGAGGCGKTRLAIEAARPLAIGFPGGVWLVRLDGLDEADLIVREIVRALQLFLPPDQTAEEVLTERLRGVSTLILLDSCDRLSGDCVQFIVDLIVSCPDLRILATRREPFGVEDEFVRNVPPLPLPRVVGPLSLPALQASEAVQLFIARAHASTGFALTRQNIAAVKKLCQAVSGIPLALELAAHWVGVLSLDDIAQQLTKHVGERPEDSGSDPSAELHTVMRATVEWSFETLNATEQALLRNLAVFAGGFTLEAAHAITGEGAGSSSRISQLLKNVVDRSLVLLDETAKPAPRYSLPEPVREFLAEESACALTAKG